jgi:hypothetical protein
MVMHKQQVVEEELEVVEIQIVGLAVEQED